MSIIHAIKGGIIRTLFFTTRLIPVPAWRRRVNASIYVLLLRVEGVRDNDMSALYKTNMLAQPTRQTCTDTTLPLTFQDMRASAAPYSITVPSRILGGPTPEAVVHALFAPRGERVKDARANVMFTWFANYWIETFFFNEFREGDVPWSLYSHATIWDRPIYGASCEAQAFLMLPDGSVRMSADGFPLRVKDVAAGELPADLVPLTRASEAADDYFICGIPRANIHPGHFVMHTLLQRNHNRVSAAIRKRHPDWAGVRVFETAKTINVYNVCLLVIEEYIAAIGGRSRLTADTNALFTSQTLRGIPWEYVLVYTFHAMPPDELAGKRFEEWLWKPNEYAAVNLGDWIQHATTTPACRQGANNTPRYLLEAEKKWLAVSRAAPVPRMNEFRAAIGFDKYKTFESMCGNDAELAARVRDLYGDVDLVDLYAGIQLEAHAPQKFFGKTTSAFLGKLAFNVIPPVMRDIEKRFGEDIGMLRKLTVQTVDALVKANLQPHEARQLTTRARLVL